MNKTTEYKHRRGKYKRWQIAVSVLASVVVFCTVYALILPAITMENSTSGEAASPDSWTPVTDTAGAEHMALVMYYCNYTEPAEDGTALGIGGYTRHQLIPGTASDGEHVDGIGGINGNGYRFEITGAYTNGGEYLIPVSYFETAYGNKQYTYGLCDYVFHSSERCPFIYASGETWASNGGTNVFNAKIMRAAEYVELNGQYYVKITAADADGQSYKIGVVYYAVMKKATDTYNPNSTVINVFDYWTTPNRTDSDNHPSSVTELNSGINANHALKFGKSMKSYGLMNYSQGGSDTPSKVTQGIVANTLGNDRFPYLSGTLVSDDGSDFMPAGTTAEQSTESLAYLFDPYMTVAGKKSFANVTGLLWQDSEGYYRYDSSLRAAELNETTGNFTEYMSPAGVFAQGDKTSGQFFPFNDAHRTTLVEAEQDPTNHYFGMSLTSRFIQQYGGKKFENSDEDVIFHFTGDNDVWIYIDNVLVADLGGLGSAASVTINFHTGDVIIDDKGLTGNPTGTPNTTIRDAFIAANPDYAASIKWNGNTLPDDTLHTLKFFYLERGNFDSNLELQYNLNQVPVSGINKVDQYGRAVDGARFAVYKADDKYNYIGDDGTIYSSSDIKGFYINPTDGNIYTSEESKNNGDPPVISSAYNGVTEDGTMEFLSDDGMPYSIEELQGMFGSNMILREVDIPDGYRTVSDETYLSIEGGVFFCDNTYQSGVWASANVLVTANNTLYIAREYAGVAKIMDEGDVIHVADRLVSGGTSEETKTIPIYSANYYTPSNNTKNGTLFSVVLKRNGRDFWKGYGYDYWYPVYGSEKTGYTVVEEGVPDEPADWSAITYDTAPTNINAVLTAAKAQAALLGENALVFQESGNGMQLLNENLPGKINRYYTFMLNNGMLDASNPSDTDPQYVVAYYWTSADSLSGATAENTVRVYSHDDLISDVDGMKLQWSTTIAVPNIENRLFFQKLNESGEKMNDAVFALYDVFEAAPSTQDGSYTYKYIYYIGKDAGGSKVYVAPLDNSAEHYQPGRAAVFGVSVDEATGKESVYVIGYGDYTVNSDVVINRDHYGNYSGVSAGESGKDIGRITVIIDTPAKKDDGTDVVPVNSEYYVDPARDADGNLLIGATHNICDIVAENGTGHFGKLLSGQYYLREIAPPAGYSLNMAEIPVLVNANGVYANAGELDDGVDVGNGIGYLCSTLDFAASHGSIDETLTWVYGALIYNDTKDFSAFSAVSGDVIHVTENGKTTGWNFISKTYHADGTTNDPPGYGSELKDRRSEAMVTYLEYAEGLAEDRDSIFDYTPTVNMVDGIDTGQAAREKAGIDGYPTPAGEGEIRLFARTGWTDLAIYQDYAHGTDQLTTFSTTNYDDLTAMGNISNLFSSSTFVRVTDKPLVDVQVREETADEPTVPLPGARFILYRTETAPDETAEEGAVTVTRYYARGASGAVSWAESESGAFMLTTDNTGLAAMFSDLTDGEYFLKETASPEDYPILDAPVRLKIERGIVTLPEVSGAGGITIDGGVRQDNGKSLYTVTVYKERTVPEPITVQLTLHKADSANPAYSYLSGAVFGLYDNAGCIGDPVAAVTESESEKGLYSILLTAPALNTYYLREEAPPDGYCLSKTVYTVSIDGNGTAFLLSGGQTVETDQNGNYLILNSSGYELPAAGGAGTTLFTIGGLLLMALAAGVYGYKKGRGRERRNE